MDDTSAQTTLGRYHLLSMLGRGGMGEVWLAEDPLLRRRVAIKRLSTYKLDNEAYFARFDREARAAAALHHPHILPVHDYGQQQLPGGKFIAYIVMSYVAGGSMEDRLVSVERQKTLLPADEALSYLAQAAEAIDYAHEQGVLHRDIKPANMLLREDSTLLLADFGLARLASDTDNMTHKSMVLGTPKYLAPEQARGEAVPSSDIYSLAVLAYRCFTGQVPFSADTVYATIVQHVTAKPPSPRQFNSALSPAFEEALLHGLAKGPAQRPPSATAFVNQLRQAILSTTSVSNQVLPQPASQTETKPIAISRRKLMVGAGVLIAGGGITAFALSSFGHDIFPIALKSVHSQPPASAKSANPDAPAIQIQVVLSQPATQLAWSPVSNTLAASGQDGQIVLWDIQAGQVNAPQPLAKYRFNKNNAPASFSFAWSPGGDMLAVSGLSSSLTSSNVIQVYKSDLTGLAAGFSTNTITSQQSISGLCWAPGHYILSLNAINGQSYQSTLSICDPRQPKQTFQSLTINGESDSYTDVMIPMAISPDGSTLAMGVTTGENTHGVLVGKIGVTGTQIHWQPYPLLQMNYMVVESLAPVSVAWSPDGRYLATVTDPSNENQRIGVWDATQQYQPLKPALDLTVSGPLSRIAWSLNAKKYLLAAAGGISGKIYLWDIGASTEPVRILPGISGHVTALSWSHDGQWLAASYDDSSESILLWKMGDSHG
jgi:serine/threonine protein kinase